MAGDSQSHREVARKNLSARLFSRCVWVGAAAGPGWRSWLGATEPALLNRAAGLVVKLKAFLLSGIESGRVIRLIRAVIAVFIRQFRYKNIK